MINIENETPIKISTPVINLATIPNINESGDSKIQPQYRTDTVLQENVLKCKPNVPNVENLHCDALFRHNALWVQDYRDGTTNSYSIISVKTNQNTYINFRGYYTIEKYGNARQFNFNQFCVPDFWSGAGTHNLYVTYKEEDNRHLPKGKTFTTE
eukprot:Pgem_evm3s8079